MEELAKYGSTGIAIALIIAICWIVKLIIPVIRDMRGSIDANTKVTTQMHTFMKALNGDIRRAVKKKRG